MTLGVEMFAAVAFAVSVTAQPLVGEEVLEPSVRNEVDHALCVASTNAVPPTAAGREFAALYATNGMSAARRAIALVSAQRGGCWYWRGTNVTPVAVALLRRLSEPAEGPAGTGRREGTQVR